MWYMYVYMCYFRYDFDMMVCEPMSYHHGQREVVDKYVVWLHVAIDDAVVMEELQTISNLKSQN